MTEFFAKRFYDNTIGQWLLAGGIIIGSLIVGKLLYWLCARVVKKLAAKSKTNLDDVIVDMVEEPVIVALTVAGVLIGLNTLTLSTTAATWIVGLRQFVIIICITWLIARLVEAVFSEFLRPLTEKSDTDLDDQLLPLARKGIKIIVWSVGTIVALNNAGYDVGALIAGLGIGGLALAMAAKDTVSNIFGGFTVFTDRPFVVGDRVQVSGIDGMVQEVGIRSTRIKTLEGRIVTLPNATFSDSAVENVSLEPSRKVVVDLGLTYDTTGERMRLAMEILKEIASGTDGVEENVLTGFDSFGDSAMTVKFIYFITKGADIMAVKTEVNLQILERFGAEKLEFAYPTQTIFTQAA